MHNKKGQASGLSNRVVFVVLILLLVVVNLVFAPTSMDLAVADGTVMTCTVQGSVSHGHGSHRRRRLG